MVLTTLFGGTRETRELVPGTYMIGRAASCHVRFDAPEVAVVYFSPHVLAHKRLPPLTT